MAEKSAEIDISKYVKKWSRKRGNLIMVLHEIQNSYGYVPREISLELSKQMDVPLARVYEVLTFYNYFKITPPGKFIISVCMGTACYLKGADKLIERFEQELGIRAGDSTTDGLFHLQEVRCVGCCGLAPAVVINGRIHGKLDPDGIPDLIAECRALVEAEKSA